MLSRKYYQCKNTEGRGGTYGVNALPCALGASLWMEDTHQELEISEDPFSWG